MKTLLVDDHALFREGLALLMAQRFPDVQLWQAEDLGQARAVLAAHPDIELVLLDLHLRDSRGADSLRSLLSTSPKVAVVALSAEADPALVDEVIAGGGAGFIPKTSRGQVIEGALRVVLQGGTYLPRELLRPMPAKQSEAARHPGPGLANGAARVGERDDDVTLYAAAANQAFDLSPRQHDVLRALIEGKANKEIARDLEIAESSVKSHLQVIFKKLGATSRAEAVLTAVRRGVAADGVV